MSANVFGSPDWVENDERDDGKVECLMCFVRRHPSNMCKISESVDGDCAEYYCQECRWGL